MPKTDWQAGVERLRIDKWLWAARFYKTRGLAVDEINKGRVQVNQALAKPAREVKVGDRIDLRIGEDVRTLLVLAIRDQRGPAPVAALMYQEDAVSLAQRLERAQQRRLAPEPGRTRATERPTKRERRATEQLRAGNWDNRWRASLD